MVQGQGQGSCTLQSYGFGICRVIICRWDNVASFIIPGCMVMVILYSSSGVRGISWPRVRVMVLAHCRVMVLVFAGSQSVAGMMLLSMYGYGYTLFMVWCQGYPMVQGQGQGSRTFQSYGFGVSRSYSVPGIIMLQVVLSQDVHYGDTLLKVWCQVYLMVQGFSYIVELWFLCSQSSEVWFSCFFLVHATIGIGCVVGTTVTTI